MLSLDRIVVSYGRVEVLHEISMEVRKGEIVALIGANGAGKSTTLRAISGVLRPTSGKIMLEGNDITGKPPERVAAAGIAHVPEGRRVFPGFTVMENLSSEGWHSADPQRRSGNGWRPSWRCSRASGNGTSSTRGRCRGASSRCWSSDVDWLPAPSC